MLWWWTVNKLFPNHRLHCENTILWNHITSNKICCWDDRAYTWPVTYTSLVAFNCAHLPMFTTDRRVANNVQFLLLSITSTEYDLEKFRRPHNDFQRFSRGGFAALIEMRVLCTTPVCTWVHHVLLLMLKNVSSSYSSYLTVLSISHPGGSTQWLLGLLSPIVSVTIPNKTEPLTL